MKIQERRITLRGDVSVLLKSAGSADAWRLWKHRHETSGETYYLACEQEEMEFFREAEEERLQATETDTREFDVSAFAGGVLIGSASVRYVRRNRKLPRTYKLKDGSYRDEIQMVCHLVDEKPAESVSEK